MTKNEFDNAIEGLPIGYEIRMSCFDERLEDEFHSRYLNAVSIHRDPYCYIAEIDFENKQHTTIMDYAETTANDDDKLEIMSIDTDDFNDIHFKKVLIDHENKRVVLV